MFKKQGDQAFWGVFLIGLAALFLFNWGIWPWILFVTAFAMIARATSRGKAWNSDMAALGLLALGGVFVFFNLVGAIFTSGTFIPVLMILIGVYLLYGSRIKVGGSEGVNWRKMGAKYVAKQYMNGKQERVDVIEGKAKRKNEEDLV